MIPRENPAYERHGIKLPLTINESEISPPVWRERLYSSGVEAILNSSEGEFTVKVI